VRVDARVLLFGLVLSALTGILFGLLPALGAARAGPHAALKDGGRAGVGRGGERARRGLVVAQVALAVVLLVGAGLLLRSFAELTHVRLGFDPAHVLTAEVRVSGERYDDSSRVNRFYDAVLDEVRRAPGVVAAGAASTLPTEGKIFSSLVVEGVPTERPGDVGFTLVRGDYFRALGIPLLAGRGIDARDGVGAPAIVVVNAAAARAFFPGGDAVGRHVRLGPDPHTPWATVVGVVGDVRDQRVDVPPGPAVYMSHAQNTWMRSLALTVRTAGDPRASERLVRRAVREADPQLAVRDVRPMEDVLGASLAARRFALGLVASFAAVALTLAAVGIYGVLAFSVTSRTREFGVRLTLGARRRSVMLLVVRQGLGWSLLGLALGAFGAALGGRVLDGVLYGVGHGDLATFAAVGAGLVVVVLVSCAVPAVRAMRVDPIESVRAE